jgi:hypothetical protein
MPSQTQSFLKLFFTIIISTAVFVPVTCLSKELKVAPLFRIERSKNANIVQYDAQLTPEGKLKPEKPVIVYWIMHANRGEKEDLNWIEKKMAYGFNMEYVPKGDFWIMDLVADIQRKIKVYKANGRYRAETLIDGHPSFIDAIYIQSTEGTIRPKVKYIEFFGKAVKTGHRVYEKFIPS